MWERFVSDPLIIDPVIHRLKKTLENQYHLDNLTALIDGYLAEIDRSATRDWVRWSDEYMTFEAWSERTDFTSPREEAQYIIDWMRTRLNQLANF
jgi:hypothetical protein